MYGTVGNWTFIWSIPFNLIDLFPSTSSIYSLQPHRSILTNILRHPVACVHIYLDTLYSDIYPRTPFALCTYILEHPAYIYIYPITPLDLCKYIPRHPVLCTYIKEQPLQCTYILGHPVQFTYIPGHPVSVL